jgi:REP element-mobilizing transposase RayT
MTNHVHFIAVPQRGDSLARAFGEAHRRYTRMRKAFGDIFFRDRGQSSARSLEVNL